MTVALSAKFQRGRPTVRAIIMLVLVAFAFSAVSTAAEASKRAAFVVGIDHYPGLATKKEPGRNQLKRAVADAKTIASILEEIGFEHVILAENVDRAEFIRAFGRFLSLIADGDTVFFFFAGHGVAPRNANYLLPADMPIPEANADLALEAFAISEAFIIKRIQERQARLTVVVLDACRDNPFERLQGAAARALASSSAGLVAPPPAAGVFSLYSAGIGQKAWDTLGKNDKSANSVFTRVFAEKLRQPRKDLASIAVEVRAEVARLVGATRDPMTDRPRRQNVAYYDQIVANPDGSGAKIYLAGPPSPPPPEFNLARVDQREDARSESRQLRDGINAGASSRLEPKMSRIVRQSFREGNGFLLFGGQQASDMEQKIASYREIVAGGGWGTVGDIPTRSLGSEDVGKLKRRLVISGDWGGSANFAGTFGPELKQAVKRAQIRHGLQADGVAGRHTLAALNISASTRLGQMETNLMRLRAITMTGDLGDQYLLVNIPAQEIQVVANGETIARSPVFVGRIDAQTPVLGSRVQSVSIFGSGSERRITQIGFPNAHGVVLSATTRNPCNFVDRLETSGGVLFHRDDLTLQSALARVLSDYQKERVPVYFTYITSWIENGVVHFRDDYYGRDGLSELLISDIQ